MPTTPTGARHGRLEITLGSRLLGFVEQHGIGWVLGGEVGVYTRRSPDTVRGADIAFITKERAPNGPPTGFLDVAPELIVEIISPADRWQDMREKINEYFAVGVQQIWVVEPENRSILVYRSATEVRTLLENDVLAGEGPLEGFSLPVAAIFAM
jgi:Uma2 family endonuclease